MPIIHLEFGERNHAWRCGIVGREHSLVFQNFFEAFEFIISKLDGVLSQRSLVTFKRLETTQPHFLKISIWVDSISISGLQNFADAPHFYFLAMLP